MNVSEKKSRVTGLPNSHDGSPRRNITVALNVHSKKISIPTSPNSILSAQRLLREHITKSEFLSS